jgi:cytochrome c oxidase subunit 2
MNLNYFLKFDTPDFFIIFWELFWFIVGGFVFYWVGKKAKEKISSESTIHKLEKYEFAWLGLAIIFYMIFSMVSLPIANSLSHSGMTSDDVLVIDATARQFSWDLRFENGTKINSATMIDSSKPINFKLTSLDVSHGFGLYNSKDDLLIQTGFFPDSNTELIIKLEPGFYKIVCMEYCGENHPGMIFYLNLI